MNIRLTIHYIITGVIHYEIKITNEIKSQIKLAFNLSNYELRINSENLKSSFYTKVTTNVY